MIAQIKDLKEEVDELSALLTGAPSDVWNLPTQFKAWTVNDVILHLYASDNLAIASATSEAAYRALRAEVTSARSSGLSMIEESRKRFPSLSGEKLRKAWVDQVDQLCSLLAQPSSEARLPWSGPDMSLKTFVSARQMETWAHGQEIFDVLGASRVAKSRILNVVVLGVKTLSWSFKNRGLPVPASLPYISLQSPDDEAWVWNAPSETNVVSGMAEEFCQVVTQVRNIGDTRLRVLGHVAQEWMSIAQCFAGPPSDPPRVGARFSAMRGVP